MNWLVMYRDEDGKVQQIDVEAFSPLGASREASRALPGQRISVITATQKDIMPEIEMARTVAEWSSRGGKWTARLTEVEGGYRIEEYKNGASCGGSYRPNAMMPDDAAAIAWGDQHCRDCFDVEMKRR